MNAKTLEAVSKHGKALLRAFPVATEQDPVALCKKLRRIETATRRAMEDYCNGLIDEEQADAVCGRAMKRVKTVLGCVQIDVEERGMFVNRDPRGCALKLGEEWTRDWNGVMLEQRKEQITTDMGGYGLLAPDLTNE